MNVFGKHNPGQGHRIEVDIPWARFARLHGRSGFGQEVLNYHFLHVPMPPVGICNGLQRGPAIRSVLSYTDQNPGRERNLCLAREFECLQSTLGSFVRCASMAGEIVAQTLDHHSLAWSDAPQLFYLCKRHCTRVGVREKARLCHHQLGHCHHIVDRGFVPVIAQPLGCRRITQLRPFAQREQRLMTTGVCSTSGDSQNLLRRHERRVEPGRRLGKGAIPTLVAAQLREGNEDLGGVGDNRSEGAIANRACLGRQLLPVQRQHLNLRVHGSPWSRCRVRPCGRIECGSARPPCCTWCTTAGVRGAFGRRRAPTRPEAPQPSSSGRPTS